MFGNPRPMGILDSDETRFPLGLLTPPGGTFDPSRGLFGAFVPRATPSARDLRADGYAALARGSSTAPVRHWTQGLARMADGMVGGYQLRQADWLEDKANQRAANAFGTGPFNVQAYQNDFAPFSFGFGGVAAPSGGFDPGGVW